MINTVIVCVTCTCVNICYIDVYSGAKCRQFLFCTQKLDLFFCSSRFKKKNGFRGRKRNDRNRFLYICPESGYQN